MSLPEPAIAPISSLRISRRSKGFSLVEVTIALAIVAFSLVAIIGLLPAGVTMSGRAGLNSAAAVIFEKVVGDARQTDYSKLVFPGAGQPNIPVTIGTSFRIPALRYFDNQGAEVIPANPLALTDEEKAKVVYQVNTRILTNTTVPSDRSPFVGQYLATVTFQIAQNPGDLPLNFTTDGLMVPIPGMDVRSLSIQVAKND